MQALDHDRAQRDRPGVNLWMSKTAAMFEEVLAKGAAGAN
jgi:hypothetical protein